MKIERHLNATTWRVLRMIIRDSRNGVTGRNLRTVNYNRHTKDGTWLDDLVKEGLMSPPVKSTTRTRRSCPHNTGRTTD